MNVKRTGLQETLHKGLRSLALWSHAYAAVRASNYLVLVQGIMRLDPHKHGSRALPDYPIIRAALGDIVGSRNSILAKEVQAI